ETPEAAATSSREKPRRPLRSTHCTVACITRSLGSSGCSVTSGLRDEVALRRRVGLGSTPCPRARHGAQHERVPTGRDGGEDPPLHHVGEVLGRVAPLELDECGEGAGLLGLLCIEQHPHRGEVAVRSEERRVGKECGCRWSPYEWKEEPR